MPLITGHPPASGAKWESVITVAGPASYATGGFIVQAVTFGLTAFDFVAAIANNNGSRFAVASFPDSSTVPDANCFIQVFTSSTGAEVAPATDLSGDTYRVYALGL